MCWGQDMLFQKGTGRPLPGEVTFEWVSEGSESAKTWGKRRQEEGTASSKAWLGGEEPGWVPSDGEGRGPGSTAPSRPLSNWGLDGREGSLGGL